MEENKFKPFDKVLVRDSRGEVWHSRLFDYRDGSMFPYVTQDGNSWVHCIPYEGNELLAGTTDNDIPKPKKAEWKPQEGDVYYAPEFKNGGYFGVWRSNWNCFSRGCFWNKYGWVFKTPEECEVFCDKLNKAIMEVK